MAYSKERKLSIIETCKEDASTLREEEATLCRDVPMHLRSTSDSYVGVFDANTKFRLALSRDGTRYCLQERVQPDGWVMRYASPTVATMVALLRCVHTGMLSVPLDMPTHAEIYSARHFADLSADERAALGRPAPELCELVATDAVATDRTKLVIRVGNERVVADRRFYRVEHFDAGRWHRLFAAWDKTGIGYYLPGNCPSLAGVLADLPEQPARYVELARERAVARV